MVLMMATFKKKKLSENMQYHDIMIKCNHPLKNKL